jgi:hypothetical protein
MDFEYFSYGALITLMGIVCLTLLWAAWEEGVLPYLIGFVVISYVVGRIAKNYFEG